jgi:NAD(P)-dependent dehydrogenase (short-subunit alcohol dehydrogenase family)
MANYLVIGGSSGIGFATAELLRREGHRVIVSTRKDEVVAEFETIQWNAESATPISIPFEALDGVVYCPGTIQLKPFHRFTEADFIQDFQINALGAAKILQECLPLLKKSSHPAVVLFSTVAVQAGMAFHSSISMAKGAVEGLTRSLAAEWAPTIRVNAIAPSLTNTPLAEKLLSSPEKMEASNKRHPLQRIGTSHDLAEMTVFLLSDKSSWITGQILHVDGGMSSIKSI